MKKTLRLKKNRRRGIVLESKISGLLHIEDDPIGLETHYYLILLYLHDFV